MTNFLCQEESTSTFFLVLLSEGGRGIIINREYLVITAQNRAQILMFELAHHRSVLVLSWLVLAVIPRQQHVQLISLIDR